MIFFVVIAAVVAMTVYVQRGVQAKIHDARNFMIDAVADNSVCDANCMLATGAVGNHIAYEYEPYYAQMIADVANNAIQSTGATTGKPEVMGAEYLKKVNESARTMITSHQLPAGCADGINPKPSYCGG